MGNISQNPFQQGTGAASSVYWGTLGYLGTTATTNPVAPPAPYVGLGVGTSSSDSPITFREALILNFDLPQDPKNTVLFGNTYAATDLSFKLLGTNALASGGSGAPADSIRLFLHIASGELLSLDVNAGALSPNPLGNPSPDNLNWGYWINYMLNQGNYADEHITGLAVEQTYGSASTPNRQFGFGSITYSTPVPEPGSMFLLGAGLIGLVGIKCRGSRSRG